MSERDIKILKDILNFCRQIEDANQQFGSNRDEFEKNSVYRNAVAMCLLQIGELAKHLSEEYKLYTSAEIPWHEIQGLRNVVAHEYGKIDTESLWETVMEDIPGLYKFCHNSVERFG